MASAGYGSGNITSGTRPTPPCHVSAGEAPQARTTEMFRRYRIASKMSWSRMLAAVSDASSTRHWTYGKSASSRSPARAALSPDAECYWWAAMKPVDGPDGPVLFVAPIHATDPRQGRYRGLLLGTCPPIPRKGCHARQPAARREQQVAHFQRHQEYCSPRQ